MSIVNMTSQYILSGHERKFLLQQEEPSLNHIEIII